MHSFAANAQRGGSSLRTNAIDAPSGENAGLLSAAPVVASGVISPSVTVTTETSAVGQSSILDVFVCENAMRSPSGDQSNDRAPNSVET